MADAYIVVGLGYGDEGKGSVVDALTRKLESKLTVKFSGGPNCGHRVVDGTKDHIFSMFSSGTLAGAVTHLDRDVLVDLFAIHGEHKELSKITINPKLTIDPSCKLITEYHRIYNRVICKNKNNTTGNGIGVCRELSLKNGLYISYRDIIDNNLTDLTLDALWDLRELVNTRLYEQGHVNIDLPSPYDVYDDLAKMAKYGTKVSPKHSIRNPIIFEGSQGILINQDVDQEFGTWADVTPRNAIDLCRRLEMSYKVIGVTRVYNTRHGAGPFPSNETIPNTHSPWCGSVRRAPINLQKLSYSANRANIDYLVVNNLDENHGFFKITSQDILDYCPSKTQLLMEGYGPRYPDKKFRIEL